MHYEKSFIINFYLAAAVLVVVVLVIAVVVDVKIRLMKGGAIKFFFALPKFILIYV